MSDADDEPPLPTDHDAWCRVVERDQLQRYPKALVVAAIQDGFNKAGVDQRVIGKMAEYISDRMESVLRGAVMAETISRRGARYRREGARRDAESAVLAHVGGRHGVAHGLLWVVTKARHRSCARRPYGR